MCVNNLYKVALDSAVAGIESATSQVQRPNHCATEPHKEDCARLRRLSLVGRAPTWGHFEG